MKKSLLLLAVGAFAVTAEAQTPVAAPNPCHDGKTVNVAQLKNEISRQHGGHNKSASRTTGVGGTRWYFYGDYLDTIFQVSAIGGGGSAYPEFISPWNDTLGVVAFTDGDQYVDMVSMGTILNPSDSAFNDENLYGGSIKITTTTPFNVDSVELVGVYGVVNTTTVDTIRLTYVYGPTSGTTPFEFYSLSGSTEWGSDINFPDLPFDSVTKISDNYAPATNKQDIILNNSTTGAQPGATSYGPDSGGVWTMHGGVLTNYTLLASGGPAAADTDANGNFYVIVPLTTPLTSVPGSDLIGVSESYFGGHPAPTGLPGDTLANFNTVGNEINNYRPYTYYAASAVGGTTPEWPPYNDTGVTNATLYSYLPYTGTNFNLNTGLYKEYPNTLDGSWTDTYLPTWAWSSSTGGAADLQYPWIELHLNCPTCDSVYYYVSHEGVNNVTNEISSVKAYPNPANNTLNISFNLAGSAPVTVSLSDVLGNTVATMNMGNTAKGKAIFFTTNLPAGIYIYTVNANGVTSTGHVAVIH